MHVQRLLLSLNGGPESSLALSLGLAVATFIREKRANVLPSGKTLFDNNVIG